MLLENVETAHELSTPPSSKTEIERDLFKRVGYYDFRAYTQLTSRGQSQGFVLARHHTLVGTVQTVFRAGKPCAGSAEALTRALEKLAKLAAIAAESRLPMGPPEANQRKSAGHHCPVKREAMRA